MINLIFAFICFIGLVVLHEFGHFILAKRFGVKVEEFGIGFPPKILGKKIGETVYSLNLLPLGAFVRLPGEIERLDDPRSFSQQSLAKRALIIAGGVISFWIIAALLLSIVFSLGTRVAIEDDAASNLVNPEVQIAIVAPGSPAQLAGLTAGDTISEIKSKEASVKITTVKEVQTLISNNAGQEITLVIQRGEEVFEKKIVPRTNPPQDEGAIGVALVRTALKQYPWYLAPWQGILATFNLTKAVAEGYFQAITNIAKGVPSGVELVGPVGVFSLLNQASRLGVSYFLNFLALISIYLAIFNVLPIPAADGGKLLFLGIEAVRKKPVDPKIEQRITAAFFSLLIILMIWVTIKDIRRLF